MALSLYVFVLFAASIFTPVFVVNISEEGKFGLYFLQDTSAIWVTALLGYYFGPSIVKYLLGSGKSSRFSPFQGAEDDKTDIKRG